MSYKLFIPGPIQVSEKTYRAMTTPVIGHRSKDFVELFQAIQPSLQKLLYTQDPVYLSTSSAWGVMEGSLRNVVKKKVLNCCSGAFSDKWYDVSLRCGLQAKELKYEWGTPIDPEDIRKELSTGEYDAITIIHNETSTGTMNPLEEIAAVLREFPEVIAIVDTVSSFSALKIDKDALGLDIILTGSQKALALPPGLALLSVSEKALKRAETVENRGYYFDFIEFQKNYEKGMTPSTPVIPLIYALKSKLEDIFEEGLENRYARHLRLNNLVREWVSKNGMELLPAPEYGSVTLNCIKNLREIDLPKLNEALKSRYNCVIDGGYGKLKGKAFRISNMGDETDETMAELLSALDSLLPEFAAK
ncbi:alanine--glyoxylate aminotransferase family protein [Ruficoccus amylovorans]|uniref:Alanine--glyoxylate aminotransferase family protein n=1 Tax=Ruficoccus amylovorans TaxID=1804625 RepID=A0A842HEB6_9BACT|nr:alanine--glyoxylate aminotransferase family protein [Ruficoccus amylovorans]MBC2594589.1 alanine--glyoxylate aminotransferase family protein [Ruficoccus amylovorans]